MINTLLKSVESKISRKIVSRGDCEYLEQRIYTDIGIKISYNTLRRVFSVDKSHTIKPRESTLNILAQFVGFDSYSSFSKETKWNQDWSSQIEISGLTDRMIEKEIILFIEKSWNKKNSFLISFVTILRELLLLREIELFLKILASKTSNIEQLSYSQQLYIGNSVGSVIRKIKLNEYDLIKLCNSQSCIKHIFLNFVDYSSLTKYYGKIPIILRENNVKIDYNQKLFFQALSQLTQIIRNQKISSINYFKIKKDDLNPILISRLASIEIAFLKEEKQDYTKILLDINQRINKSAFKKADFLYELKTISLLLRDFELMQWIIKTEKQKVEESYQIAHKQFLYLVQLAYAIKQSDKREIRALLKLINPTERQLSYYDFQSVFHSICLYHVSQSNTDKSQHLEDYLGITAKLDFPIFTQSYCINYF